MPILFDHFLLPDMNFNGYSWTENNISKISLISKKVINLYNCYTLRPQVRNLNTNFTLGNSFFGSAKLTKNADPYK